MYKIQRPAGLAFRSVGRDTLELKHNSSVEKEEMNVVSVMMNLLQRESLALRNPSKPLLGLLTTLTTLGQAVFLLRSESSFSSNATNFSHSSCLCIIHKTTKCTNKPFF